MLEMKDLIKEKLIKRDVEKKPKDTSSNKKKILLDKLKKRK